MLQGVNQGKYVIQLCIAEPCQKARQSQDGINDIQPLPRCTVNGHELHAVGPSVWQYPHGWPARLGGHLFGSFFFGEVMVFKDSCDVPFKIENRSVISQSDGYFMVNRIQMIKSPWKP